MVKTVATETFDIHGPKPGLYKNKVGSVIWITKWDKTLAGGKIRGSGVVVHTEDTSALGFYSETWLHELLTPFVGVVSIES